MSIEIIGTQIDQTEQAPVVLGSEKIPTGGRGLYHVTVDQVRDYVLTYFGKDSIRLGEVDNTSDENKPLSKATRDALNKKLSKTDPYVRSINGLTGDIDLVPTVLGLGKVDNTSDKDKPLSEASIRALATKLDKITFKDFKRFFDNFKNEVDRTFQEQTLLNELIKNRVADLESADDELRQALLHLTSYLNTEIARVSSTLSAEQQQQVLALIGDNFEAFLQGSGYLTSALDNLHTVVLEEISSITDKVTALGIKDSKIDEEIQALTLNINKKFSSLDEEILDLNFTLDSQANAFARQFTEAHDYLEAQINKLKPLIEQASQKYLEDLLELQQTISKDSNEIRDSLTGLQNSLEEQSDEMIALDFALNSKHDDLLDLMKSEDKTLAELIESASETAKQDMLDLGYQMQELSDGFIRKYDEVYGIIETQVESTKLIMNDKIVETKELIDQAKEDVEQTKVALEELRSDALETADFYETKLSEISDYLENKSEALLSQLAQEVIDRNNAINAKAEDVLSKVNDRLNNLDLVAIQELDDKINALNDKLVQGSINLSEEFIDYINSQITSNNNTVDLKVQNVVDKLEKETADRLEKIKLLEDGLTKETMLRQEQDSTILSELENYKLSTENSLANYREEINVKIGDALAESESITALDSRVNALDEKTGKLTTSVSNVTEKLNTTATALESTASQLSALSTEYQSNDAIVKGLILEESQNRSTALGNVTSKLDSLSSSFDSLNAPGRNILKGSNVELVRTGSEYLIGTYKVGEPIVPGAQYTLIACITHETPESDLTYAEIRGWQDSSTPLSFGATRGSSKRIVKTTFTAKVNGFSGINFYYYPSTATSGLGIIHWAVLVKGEALPLTDWVESPYDREARDAATTASINNLNTVITTKTDALAEQIKIVNAGVEAQGLSINSTIQEVNKTIADLDSTTGSKFEAINSKFTTERSTTDALIASESKARSDALSATTEYIDSFKSSFSGTGVNLLSSIYSDPDSLRKVSLANVSATVTPPELDNNLPGSWTVSRTTTGSAYIAFSSSLSNYTSLELKSNSDYIVSGYFESVPANVTARFALKTNLGVIVNGTTFTINALGRFSSVIRLPSTVGTSSGFLLLYVDVAGSVTAAKINVNRLMVERRIGTSSDPSEWVPGNANTIANVIQQIKTTSTATASVVERLDALVTKVADNDTSVRGVIAEEIKNVTDLNSNTLSKVETLSSSFSNQVVGSENLWWLAESSSDYGARTVESLTTDQQHQKLTITATAPGLFSNLWRPLLRTENVKIDTTATYAISFEVKAAYPFIRVYSYIFGQSDPIVNKLVTVIPDKWTTIKLDNLVSVNANASETYSGLLGIRYLVSDNPSITEEDMIGKTLEIRDVQLQKGTTTSAYTKPLWVQRNEQKAIVDAAVTSETKARTTAEEAFTARIDGLVTTIESNDSTVKGLIATESQNRSTALTNVTTKLDTLSSSFESFTIGGANLLPYSNVFRDRATMSLQDTTNLQVAVENGVLRLNFTPTVSTSSWFTSWWPTDVNIDQALSEIKNSGVHAILSIWVKAVDVTKLPSTLPLIHLCSEYSYRPFTGVIGDISKGGWVQYYQLYDFSTRDPGTIHPHLQLSANSLGGGLLFSKWKFEIGDKPTDWSEYKEASKLLAEKTDATIVRVDKAITDANTANANAFTAVNAVLTDMPNAGINLLKGSVTNPTALTSFFNVTPAAVTPELYTTAFNSKLKGIKFTTKSTVTTNVFVYDTTQTASFTNLLPGSYVLSFWASSTTVGHSIKVGLQSTASVIVESSTSIPLTTTLTRYQVVLTIATAGKYAVRLTPNVSGVSGRVFSVERLMLEQQYGNNIVPSAWVEGLETSPYSLTPVNMSQALISQELDTNVSKTNATATLVNTLTTTVTNNDTFARSKLVEVTDSITNLSSTSNSKMETMASEFRKTLVTSSNNLWVFKNYRSYNGAEILPNSEEYSYNFQIGSSTYSGITGDLPEPEMKENGLYTFSYSLEIISGTLTSIGYATTGTSSWSRVEAYFNDELITLDANLTYTLPVPLTSGVHHVVFVVKCLKVGTCSFHIQPNRANTTAITTKVFQVALTKGTMKLPWELSLEDQGEQLANTKAYINTVQKTLADADSALTEKFETLNTQVSSDRGTTSGEIARLDKNYSDLNSNTTQAFEGISSKFSAMPNGGVNLLPIEVSNPPSLPKPMYTSGHRLAVEGSTDTAGINRWKLTTGNANVGSGCYFNPGGGQTNLHLRLPVGKFIFSCYMKTESEDSHQVAWVLYNTGKASTNFTLSSTLTRFSFVINNNVERNVCFLLMGNKSGIPGDISFYVERMMLEVQNGDNQSPSVWAAGTSDITRQLAVTAESVTTAYTDANKAIGTRIDTLKSSFEGQSIGGDNLWSLLDVATIRSAQGTATKTDVNKDQEHCKVVINSFASNGCMLSFDNLLVDTAAMLLSGEDHTLTFELKSNKALPVTISTSVGALGTFTTTANTTTGWIKYSFSFKSNGTSTTGANQSFAILCLSTSGWAVNDWYEIKSVQLQKGNKATGFQKATKVLTDRIVKTAADISSHKETYASDKLANATAMDKMSAIFKSSAGSLTSDYILAIGTEWAHNYTDTDISAGFVKISDGKVGDTAYVKIGGTGTASKYNIIHNKTPLVATGVYVVSYWAKREIGSTGTTYISVGLKNATGFIRYGRLTTITSKTPADGQWHFVSENIDVDGLADPTCYLGFGINHGDETKKAWIQGFKVTRLLTAGDTDSSVASTATLTTVQNTLSNATKAVADRTSLLETGLSKTNEAVATKADSKILDSYYTSSKTDEVVAGKIANYNTSLVIGGNNLISEMKLISGYINTEGGVSTATYDVHDPNYYEIKPGETLAGTYYSLNGVDGTGSTGRVAFYNKDKGFLSAHTWITSTSLNDPKYIVAPANSAFFRFSTLAKGIKHKLERGTKATDWSASIDDVQATLNVQAGLISDNNTKIIDQGKVLSTQGTSLTSIDLRLNSIGGTNLFAISSTEVGNIQNGVDVSSTAFWRTIKTNPIAILPSMSYTFSAKIACAMAVQWYSEANGYISQVWSTDVTATTSTTLKSPANAGYMRVAFRNSTTTNFNLSDAKFKIEEGLVATRWSPCPQDLVTNGDNVVIGGDKAVTHSVTSGTNKTLELYEVLDVPSKLPIKEGDPIVVSFDWTASVAFPSTTTMTIQWHGAYYNFIKGVNTHTFDGVTKEGRTVLKGTFICPNATTSNNKVKLGIRTDSTTVGSITVRNLAMYRGTVDQPFKLGPSDLATASAVSALTGRVDKTEEGLTTSSQNTTSLKNMITTGMSADSLVGDYAVSNNSFWYNHSTIPASPAEVRFTTVSDGKIGKTVFMVPDGTSHGFIYSKTGLPNTRQYKVTFWARRSSTAVGSSYVTVLRIPPSGVISTSGYTYMDVTGQIPGTEVWTQVSQVIDLRSSADAYPTLHFGFCINNNTAAGWSQVQGFKVEPVLSSKDLDTSVATSEALETLKSRVTKTEAGDITVNNEKLVDLKGKVDTTAGGTFSSTALDKMYTTTNFKSAVSGRLTEFNSSLVIGGANLISHGHSSFRVGSTSVTAAVRTIVDGAIRVTGGLPTTWYGWQNASTDWSQLVKLGPGSDFTVSLFVRAVSLTALPNVGFQIYVGGGYGYSAMAQVGTGVYTNGGLVQFAKTFTVTTTVISPNPHMHVTGTIGGGFEIVAWKIEKGNKATDWSMADKDIQIQLDSNASAINNIFTTAKWNEAVAGKLETYTSNLKVGSTNLLPNSDYSFGYDVWGATLGTVAEINDATSRSKTWKITCTTGGNLGLQQNSISRTMSIVKGVKYVLSFKASGTNIAVVDYLHIMRPSGGNQRLGSVSGLTSTTSDFKIEFVAEWSSTTAWLLFGAQLSVGATITVSEIKIEEGSVVTSWAPSPKDVDYQLTQNAESTRLVQAWVDTNKSNVSDITSIKASTTAVRNDFDNILPLIRSVTSANLVYGDPTFLEGSNSVSAYDNGKSNRVLVTRVPREADNPTTSTHQVNVTVSSGAAPGYGGFFQWVQSRASAVFLVKYLLKLPVGYKLVQANNSMGLNAVDNFVGSTLGTGNYEFYYRLIRCGSTGSFSSTGHVYVTNTSTTMLTGTQTMTFPLASVETYDLTDYAAINPQLKKMLTTYTNSIDALTDKDSSQGFKYEQLKSTFSMSSAVNQIPLAMNYDQKDKWIYVEYSRPTTIPVSKNITYEDINGLTPSRSMYVPQAIASGTAGGTADTNSMTASCLAIFRTMVYSSKAVSIAWGGVAGDDLWSLNVNGVEVSKTTVYTSSGISVTLPLKAGWNYVDVLVNNNGSVGGFRATVLLNTLVERMYAPDLADLNPNNAATILAGYYTKSDIDSSVAEKIQGASAKYALQLVTIPDTRSVNSTPLEYYTNYSRRVVHEFKYGSSIGSPGGMTGYGILETTVPWNDASGGAVQQIFTMSDVSANTWSRYSTSNTAWSPWKNSLLDIRTDLSLKANDADIKETFLAKADADNAVASALTTIAAKIGSDNILINGDFSASSISPWSANTVSNTVVIYTDANKKKWGRVASTNTTVQFKGILQSITPDRNGLKANQTYTISFTLKAMNTATTSVSLIIHRVNSAGNNQLTTSFSINTTNETFCKYTFTTVADITNLNIIPVANTGIAPDFLITDVQLQEGTYATAFQKSSVELSSAIQVQGEAISGANGINTKYTVKIDNGGLISGYGIIGSNNNGTPTSAFAVNASQFYIGTPANNKKPFIVLTAPGSVGGVTVPAGTYMDTAFIGDATITNAKIGELSASKITSGVIDAARIRVGGTSTYDDGYNPAANLQAAKDYVDIDNYSHHKVFNSVAGYQERVSTVSGVLVIKTPITMNAYMSQVDISGYNYFSTSETLFNISLGFYAYSGTSFLNTRAKYSGVKLDSIKLALDANKKVVILIKKTGNWSYPLVNVDKVTMGYTMPPDTMKDGWSISFEADVSAYTVNFALAVDESETTAGAAAKVATVAAQITDIAADNKLTAVEKKNTKLIWNDIQKGYETLSAQGTALSLSYAALTTAYNSLNTYITPLLANVNVTSDIVRSTFETNFSNYHKAAADFESLLALWSVNIASSTTVIGENLFSISDCTDGYVNTTSGNITTASANHQTMQTLLEVGKNTTLVYQCWNDSDAATTNTNRVAFFDINKAVVSIIGLPTLTSGLQYQTLSIAIPASAAYVRLGAVKGSTGFDPDVRIKFEFGTTPTDWSPASSDIGRFNVDTYTRGVNLVSYSDIEQGTYKEASAVGTLYHDMLLTYATRLRTKDLILIDDVLNISIKTGYQIAISFFDGAKKYLGQTAGFINWTSTYNLKNTKAKYVAIAISKTDNSNIFVTDFLSTQLMVERSYTTSPWSPSSEDATKSMLSSMEVGGVNLLYDTTNITTWNKWALGVGSGLTGTRSLNSSNQMVLTLNSGGTSLADLSLKQSVTIVPGSAKAIKLSADLSALSGDVVGKVYILQSVGGTSLTSAYSDAFSTNGRIQLSVDLRPNTNNILVWLSLYPSVIGGGGTGTYDKIKLELGDVFTNWSPNPLEVQSSIDLKTKTFVSTPTVPYVVGDIWKNGSTIYVCNKTKKASEAYAVADWVLVGDITSQNTSADTSKVNGVAAKTVTDNAAAGKLMSDQITSDLIITPVEKTALYNEWNRIKSEYASLIASASSYGVASTALTTAYNALNSTAPTVPSVLTSMTAVTTFTAAQRDSFRTKFNTYYTQATALDKAIKTQISVNSQTLVDDIVVGGRNYLLNSAATNTTKTFSPDWDIRQLAGKDVTISFDLEILTEATAASTNRIGYELNYKDTEGVTRYIGAWRTGLFGAGLIKERIVNTIRLPNSVATSNPTTLAYYYQLTGGTCRVTNVKVEIGNKATAWSLAPEEMARSFTSSPTVPYSVGDIWKNGSTLYVCTTAKGITGAYALADWTLVGDVTSQNVAKDTAAVNGVAAKTVADNAAAGKAISDDILSDLIITPVEKTALYNEWNRIKSEYTNLVSQGSANDVVTTSLTTAYNALNGTAPTVPSVLTSMTAKTTFTAAQRDAFRTKFNTYYTAATALDTAIQAKMVTKAQEDLSNLVIGGGNLVDNSSGTFSVGSAGDAKMVRQVLANGNLQITSSATFASTYLTGIIPAQTINPLTLLSNGEKFVVSFWIKAVDKTKLPTTNITCYLNDKNGYIALKGDLSRLASGQEVRFSRVAQFNSASTALSLHLNMGDTGIGGGIIITKWQIERGDVPSDWTQHPLDITSQISRATSIVDFSGGKTFFNPLSFRSTITSGTTPFAINTPITIGAFMCSMEVSGYNYENSQSSLWKAFVSVYVYTVATPFYNYNVRTEGADLTVRAGIKNGKVTFFINKTGQWSYPCITVDKITIMHGSASDSLGAGWSGSMGEDISTFTNVVTFPNTKLETEAGAAAKVAAVNALISDIASDSKLTPVEKNTVKLTWNDIVKDHPQLVAQASTAGASSADLVSKYNTLNSYITPLLSNVKISSDIVRSTFETNFSNYFNSRSTLQSAIDAAIVSKAKTDLDNLSVGGTNLLNYSDFSDGYSTTWETNGGGMTVVQDANLGKQVIQTNMISGFVHKTWLKLENGIEYTYSALLKSVGVERPLTTSYPLHYHVGTNSVNQGKISVISTTPAVIPADTWTRCSITFKLTGDANSFRPFIYGGASGTLQVAWLQLEKGSKATDWSPSPTDVSLALSSKSKTFTATPTVPYSVGDMWKNGQTVYVCTTSKLSTGVYALGDWTLVGDVTSANTSADTSKVNGVAAKTVADGAAAGQLMSNNILSDLVVTPVEKTALYNEWNRIKAEYTNVLAQANTYKVSATNFTNAYNALNSTAPTVPSVLSSMTANTTFTTTERDNFRTKFNTYYVQSTAIAKAIEVAIAAKAQSDLDSLVIGGTNLFPVSLASKGFYISSGNLTASTTNHVSYDKFLEVGSQTSLVYQCWNTGLITSGNSNRINFYTADKVFISQVGMPLLSSTVPYQVLKIAIPTNAVYFKIGVIMGASSFNDNLKIKVEFGGTPTDWSAAPEDSQTTWETYVKDNTGNLLNNVTSSGTMEKWTNGTVTNQTFQGISVPVHTLVSTGDLQTHSTRFAVDPSKAYEVSGWFKTDQTVGSLYFGLVGQNGAGASIGFHAINRLNPVETSTANTNFYFHSVSGGGNPLDWVHWVGYIMPAGTPASQMKFLGNNVGTNARMLPQTAFVQVRWLNFYNSGTSTTKWAANLKCVEVDPNAIALANSKSQTFITTPVVPYVIGDVWKDGTTVKIATVNRTSGSYTASDWALVGDVTANNTSANTAKVGNTTAATIEANSLAGANISADILSDLIITPVEKTALYNEWNRIKAEYTNQLAQASSLSVATANYTTAYNAIDGTAPKITTILASMSAKTTLTTTERDNFRTQINNYYTQSTGIAKAITQAVINKASNDLSPVLTAVNNMSSDSILTPLEKHQTKTIWDSIANGHTNLLAQAATAGVAATTYTTAYNTLNTYVTGLLSSMTANSTIVRSTFNTNFANLYTQRSALEKLISDASFTIGGENLLDNSSFTVNTTGWANNGGTNTIVAQTVGNGASKCLSIVATGANQGVYRNIGGRYNATGVPITVSFWAKASAALNLYVSNENHTGSSTFALTTAWKYYTATLTKNSANPNIVIYSGAAGTFYISQLKYEKGAVATAWSPSTYELEASINTATSTANTANGTANTANSTANTANNTANTANNTVNGWKYSGTTYIDGNKIQANTIEANRIKVASLSSFAFTTNTARIGTLTTKGTSGSMTISDTLIEIRDATGNVRVRLGIW